MALFVFKPFCKDLIFDLTAIIAYIEERAFQIRPADKFRPNIKFPFLDKFRVKYVGV